MVLIKPLLKFTLPDPNDDKNRDHQRLFAIKILNSIVDTSKGFPPLLEALSESVEVLGSTLETVVRSNKSWKKDRV